MKELDISEQLLLHVKLNDMEGAKRCIEKGANVNYIDNNQYTILAYSGNMFNFDMFMFLLENKADPKQLLKTGITIFELFKSFFETKENYNQTNDEYYIESKKFFNDVKNQERMIEINYDIYFLLKKSNLILPEIINKYKYIENTRDLNLI